MDVNVLLAKRQAIVARFQLMESVKESPWSPDHPVMQQAMREDGAVLGSTRPVALKDDTRMYFCGPDVGVVLDAARRYVDAQSGDKELQAREQFAVTVCKEMLADNEGKTAEFLRMGTQEFNHVLIVLNAAGLQVVSSDVK